MYMFATTPEPDNPFYDRAGIAAAMRGKLVKTAPAIGALANRISEPERRWLRSQIREILFTSDRAGLSNIDPPHPFTKGGTLPEGWQIGP